MKKIIIWFIKFYQTAISPLKGRTCRFYPTCSQYTINAIEKYGCPRGIVMGVLRVCKCHPLHPGGYDPVK